MQDTSTASTSPPAAVAAARGLLWLTEMCRDEGITVVALDWAPSTGHMVIVRTVDELDRLADRLTLRRVHREYPTAVGLWADLHVTVAAIEVEA